MTVVKYLLKILTLIFALTGIHLTAQDVVYMKCLDCHPTCNCYWSSECGSGEHCSYNGCTVSGKLDGVCTTLTGGGGAGGVAGVIDLAGVVAAVGSYFDAYEAPMRGAGGLPDINMVRKAQAEPLPAAGHLAVQRIVINALDLALGWDFVGPQSCLGAGEPGRLAPGSLGQIRLPAKDAPSEQPEMLAAMRQAIVDALKSRDANQVSGPIQAFWRRHPDYKPRHTGRCWPHGHTDFPYKTPCECQIDELKRMLGPFLKAEGRQQGLIDRLHLEGVPDNSVQKMTFARCEAPAMATPPETAPSQK